MTAARSRRLRVRVDAAPLTRPDWSLTLWSGVGGLECRGVVGDLATRQEAMARLAAIEACEAESVSVVVVLGPGGACAAYDRDPGTGVLVLRRAGRPDDRSPSGDVLRGSR